MNSRNRRAGERGAISIKAILMIFATLCVAFVLLKVVPVYVEQRKVTYDVEELARIAAVRNYNNDKIAPEIAKIRGTYELPEGSINLLDRKGQSVQIAINYKRSIDLLVTTYDWTVTQTVIGKDI
jgi:hypothetical protein